MTTTTFSGIGQALRWLRERQSRKQYQVADLAGITKGMLSAYETGRQRPSLETLEKLLATLGCDLNDLHNAIQIVNGRPEAIRRFADPSRRSAVFVDAAPGGGRGAEAGLYPVRGDAGPATAAGIAGAAGADQPYPFRRAASARSVGAGPSDPHLADEIAEPADWPPSAPGAESVELYRLLERSTALPEDEELALSQMLNGFHRLLRYWDGALERLRDVAAGEPPAPA